MAGFYAAGDAARTARYSGFMSEPLHTDPSYKAQSAILARALIIAPFEGWTAMSLRTAAREAGLPKGADALYFPGGPLELLGFWAGELDRAAEAHLRGLDLDAMKIRDKVTAGVTARLEALSGHEAAARRAAARLALLDAAGQGPAQLWTAADTIWRAIGDTSTDANYYSKRAILSAVLGTSLMAWVSDERLDKRQGRAFIEARINGVMRFETTKWQVKEAVKDWPHPAELLGKIGRGGGPRRRRRSGRWN